jgi:hypothetical protein
VDVSKINFLVKNMCTSPDAYSVTQYAITENTVNYFEEAAILSVLNTRPFVDYSLKDDQGNYGLLYGSAARSDWGNPNYYFQYSRRKRSTRDLIQSFAASYKINNWLVAEGRFGFTTFQNEDRVVVDDQSANKNYQATKRYIGITNQFGATGEQLNRDGNCLIEQTSLQLTASLDFKRDMGVSLPLKSITMTSAEWRDFSSDHSESVRPAYMFSSKAKISTKSLLFSQIFKYDEWLEFSGSFRKDFASPQTHSIDGFGHGAIATTLSKLTFWKSSRVLRRISDFNVRAAMGKAGVPVFNTYQQGLITSTEKEIGIDVGFNSLKKGKLFSSLTFSITRWERGTSSADTPSQYGTGAGYFPGIYIQPTYSISSHGLQFSMTTQVFTLPKLEWTFTTMFNKCAYHLELNQIGYLSLGDYFFLPGENLNLATSNLLLTSVNQKDANGAPFIPPSQQNDYTVASNGVVVNSTTRTPATAQTEIFKGDPSPKFNMSFINNVKILRLINLSFQLDWFYKNHLYNDAKRQIYIGGFHPDYMKPITINGATGAWTAFYLENAGLGTNFFYEDASFLRLRNVAVRFNLADVMGFSKLRKLNLEFSGRNILTWTNYTGMDPEVNSGEPQSGWQRGIDKGTMPNIKSFQIGLSVGL